MRELFPHTFGHIPTWAWKSPYSVIQNWLEQEITPAPIKEIPTLEDVLGWRNREVHDYVAVQFDERWDKELCLKLYGRYEMVNEQPPAWMKAGWHPHWHVPRLRLVVNNG